jgi:hypothetical protein
MHLLLAKNHTHNAPYIVQTSQLQGSRKRTASPDDIDPPRSATTRMDTTIPKRRPIASKQRKPPTPPRPENYQSFRRAASFLQEGAGGTASDPEIVTSSQSDAIGDNDDGLDDSHEWSGILSLPHRSPSRTDLFCDFEDENDDDETDKALLEEATRMYQRQQQDRNERVASTVSNRRQQSTAVPRDTAHPNVTVEGIYDMSPNRASQVNLPTPKNIRSVVRQPGDRRTSRARGAPPSVAEAALLHEQLKLEKWKFLHAREERLAKEAETARIRELEAASLRRRFMASSASRVEDEEDRILREYWGE